MVKLNKIIKKVLKESIIDWELYHKIKRTPTIIETENKYSPEERKLKLIQNYLDNVIVPGNNLICDAKVYRFTNFTNNDEYTITIWFDPNVEWGRDEFDNLIDDTWDEIYNMFDIPVSIRRVKGDC